MIFIVFNFSRRKNSPTKLRFSRTKLKLLPLLLKFRSSLWGGLRCQERVALVALRRARNLFSALFFLIAFSFAPAYAKEKAGWSRYFLFWLLTTLGFYLVGVGAYDDPRRDIKKLFLSYFSLTKSTKSQQRELSPLFANLPRVHELVARAMRGKCVRRRANGASR